MKQTFRIGLDFQSDTEYVADRPRYDVTMKDTMEGPGVPYIGNRVAVLIRNKENITLDFAGATLFLHGKIQPFYFEGCKNITVKNVVVEYDRSSVTEGLITERGEDYLRLRLNPRHTCRVENGQLIPYGEGWENHELNRYVMFINSVDGETREGLGFKLGLVGKDPYVSPENQWSEQAVLFDVEDAGNGEIILRGNKFSKSYRPGAVMIFSHERRTISNLATRSCENLNIENYRILNGVGMGIFLLHTKNVHIDGLKLFHDERSDALTTNGADAIHSFSASGEFVVENCRIEGTIDDALNVHSSFYRVERLEGTRLTLVSLCYGTDTGITIFADGERVRFYHGNTVAGGTDAVAKKVTILDGTHLEVELDRPVTGVVPGDAVENPDANCNLTIRNCTFGKSPTSHLRFQNGGKLLVEDCETSFSFLFTGDMNFWYESSYVQDCVIRNCRFVGNRMEILAIPEFTPTDDAPYYHRNITVENCEFDSECNIKFNNVQSVTFRGNRNTKGLPMRAELKDCGKFTGDGIEVTRTADR